MLDNKTPVKKFEKYGTIGLCNWLPSQKNWTNRFVSSSPSMSGNKAIIRLWRHSPRRSSDLCRISRRKEPSRKGKSEARLGVLKPILLWNCFDVYAVVSTSDIEKRAYLQGICWSRLLYGIILPLKGLLPISSFMMIKTSWKSLSRHSEGGTMIGQ